MIQSVSRHQNKHQIAAQIGIFSKDFKLKRSKTKMEGGGEKLPKWRRKKRRGQPPP